MKELRRDIQALRGWAVGLVLLDHVGIGPFAHGYLGVDIFFVISGFLITRIISRGVAGGNFSFAGFYFGRAKRLLPAAYVTILLTIIGAHWFLTSLEMQDLTAQVFGALTWTTNFVLMAQTDYFAGAADLKPLLHMWSLAVEEQFYLAMPVLLFFTPARFWRALIVALFAASLVWCVYLVDIDQSQAFYMLPSRAWELALGGIGALVAFDRGWQLKLLGHAFWPATALLVVVPIWSTGYPHPGIDALLVCVATLIVILRHHEPFGHATKAVGLVQIGDMSYSLYLVHWPIVAFINNAYIGEPTGEFRLTALALSLIAGAALYYGVERPIHQAKAFPSMRNALAALTTTIFLAGLQFGASAAGDPDLAQMRRPNHGLDKICATSRSVHEAVCRTSKEPGTLVWGDSYAMHLVPGIVPLAPDGLVQMTLSACPPLRGMAYHRPEIKNPKEWARACIRFNDDALSELAQLPSIRTVVLSSPFRGFETGASVWRLENGKLVHGTANVSDAASALNETVEAISSLGKDVIIVSPPPYLGTVDISVCIERRMANKVSFGPNADCKILKADAIARDASTYSILNAVRGSGAKVIELPKYLCDEKTCISQIDGTSIYRDAGHMSHSGSVKVMGLTGMASLLSR